MWGEKEMAEDNRKLDDNQLENVEGGQISDFNKVLLGLWVAAAIKEGKTLEEVIADFEKKYQEKTPEYYEAVGLIYTIYNELKNGNV